MKNKLTAKTIKTLPIPDKGSKVYYGDEVPGFGVRVTAADVRSFVLNYRTKEGKERRYTIGRVGEVSLEAARDRAKEIRAAVALGSDPMGELHEERAAPTVADLCDRYTKEDLLKRRPATRRGYEVAINKDILPALKAKKVKDINFSDIDALHRKITKRGNPYAANRCVALLSRLFALAMRWGWTDNNPAKGIERNPEAKRRRYLTPTEIAALTKALSEHRDQQAANILRLLLLTGARRGEVHAMKWADLDLSAGVWSKPGSTTKQRTDHIVPLGAPARQLLADLRKAADDAGVKSVYVFPSGESFRKEVKKNWAAVCKAAGLVESRTVKGRNGKVRTSVEPNVRMHDLRHSFASVLASSGASLQVIGALLGHTQTQTTARYSHLYDDPLRAAADRVGAVVMGTKTAEVIPIKGAS